MYKTKQNNVNGHNCFFFFVFLGGRVTTDLLCVPQETSLKKKEPLLFLVRGNTKRRCVKSNTILKM